MFKVLITQDGKTWKGNDMRFRVANDPEGSYKGPMTAMTFITQVVGRMIGVRKAIIVRDDGSSAGEWTPIHYEGQDHGLSKLDRALWEKNA